MYFALFHYESKWATVGGERNKTQIRTCALSSFHYTPLILEVNYKMTMACPPPVEHGHWSNLTWGYSGIHSHLLLADFYPYVESLPSPFKSQFGSPPNKQLKKNTTFFIS